MLHEHWSYVESEPYFLPTGWCGRWKRGRTSRYSKEHHGLQDHAGKQSKERYFSRFKIR